MRAGHFLWRLLRLGRREIGAPKKVDAGYGIGGDRGPETSHRLEPLLEVAVVTL